MKKLYESANENRRIKERIFAITTRPAVRINERFKNLQLKYITMMLMDLAFQNSSTLADKIKRYNRHFEISQQLFVYKGLIHPGGSKPKSILMKES